MKHILKGIGFFEYVLIAIVCMGIGLVAFIALSRTAYITVTIKLENRDLLYTDNGAYSAIDVAVYKPGQIGKDAFGRVNAEIIGVRAIPMPQTTTYGNKDAIYVSLKLLAGYNKAKDVYSYQGNNLEYGDWLRVEVGPVVVEGILTDINSRFANFARKTMVVKSQLKTEDPFAPAIFQNTTGVDPYIADAIHIGDEMKDEEGHVIVTILDKSVTPADTVTTDIYGNLYDKPNPRKKDVYLTVQLSVIRVGSNYYFLDDQPVQVNSRLPLLLPLIRIEPRVTEIVSP
jgi:hypothetical protein